MTRKEAAKYIKCSESILAAWEKDNSVQRLKFRKENGIAIYEKKDCDEFLADMKEWAKKNPL